MLVENESNLNELSTKSYNIRSSTNTASHNSILGILVAVKPLADTTFKDEMEGSEFSMDNHLWNIISIQKKAHVSILVSLCCCYCLSVDLQQFLPTVIK